MLNNLNSRNGSLHFYKHNFYRFLRVKLQYWTQHIAVRQGNKSKMGNVWDLCISTADFSVCGCSNLSWKIDCALKQRNEQQKENEENKATIRKRETGVS